MYIVGKMVFRTPDVFTKLASKNLLPIRYVDHSNKPTESYPLNPNGSQGTQV